MWPKASSAQVLPPPFGVQSRRPQNLRRREENEAVNIPETQATKLRRFGVQMTCQLCKGFEHNIRTCKEKNNTNFVKPIKVLVS